MKNVCCTAYTSEVASLGVHGKFRISFIFLLSCLHDLFFQAAARCMKSWLHDGCPLHGEGLVLPCCGSKFQGEWSHDSTHPLFMTSNKTQAKPASA